MYLRNRLSEGCTINFLDTMMFYGKISVTSKQAISGVRRDILMLGQGPIWGILYCLTTGAWLVVADPGDINLHKSCLICLKFAWGTGVCRVKCFD